MNIGRKEKFFLKWGEDSLKDASRICLAVDSRNKEKGSCWSGDNCHVLKSIPILLPSSDGV